MKILLHACFCRNFCSFVRFLLDKSESDAIIRGGGGKDVRTESYTVKIDCNLCHGG